MADNQLETRTFVTNHAIDRYRLHFPGASRGDVWDAVQDALPLSPDDLWLIAGCPADPRCRYAIAGHGRGVFIIESRSPRRRVVITYLRGVNAGAVNRHFAEFYT